MSNAAVPSDVSEESASPAAAAPALEITDLRYRFRAREGEEPGGWLIDLPRLTLSAGEQMLLQAPSGRGKSTLLYLIAGLYDLDGPEAAPGCTGRINVAGRNMHALKRSDRDKFRGLHVGMIFQTFNLLQGFSALENVLAALMFSDLPKGRHEARARELLASLGIERTHATPDRLSVGQQQRVAVARALACRPTLVLADEPTASLDPENAAAALDLIQSACRDQGAALLLVSHDPSVAGRFRRVERL